jgi:hypothetical protein
LRAGSATITNLIATSASITTLTNNPTFSGGTANGVLFLNGSKVATSGTGLVFDGTRLGVGASSPTSKLEIYDASTGAILTLNSNTNGSSRGIEWRNNPTANNFGSITADYTSGVFTYDAGLAVYAGAHAFRVGTSGEAMRLNSTGLGVGTSSPGQKLTVQGGINVTSSATLPVAQGSMMFSYEAPINRIYMGDGTGYSFAFSKRASSTTTDLMTLTDGGNLGIGTSSPVARLDVQSSTFGGRNARFIDNSGVGSGGRGSGISLGGISNDTGPVITEYARLVGLKTNATQGNTQGYLTFETDGGSGLVERARITSGGFFKASNTGTYSSSTNDRYEFTSDKNDLTILVNSTNTGANVNNVYSQLPAGANAGAYHFVGSISGSGLQFTVDADGDVKNTNNSYGSISDIKLKQDVVDAASQWDDIKALRVRKYRFKRNPDAALQIGLVAQEAEAVSPGLVEETADRDEEGNDLGTTTKSVKYSVLYMKAVKALQEAMTRIEQLEAKFAALESK